MRHTCPVVAAVCLLAACSPSRPSSHTDDPAPDEQSIWSRAICDEIRCEDPAASAAACEAEWGEASGKTYSIWASCSGTWTNSDCFSDCFRNHCRCGSTAGTPNACPGPIESGADWPVCRCDHTGNSTDPSEDEKSGASTESGSSSGSLIRHRYWCCNDRCGTIQGWSDTDHCGC